MSGYKNFAIAGAGRLGTYIVEELLNLKAAGKVNRAVVLTRSTSGKEPLRTKGAELAVIDYASPTSLAPALKGIDVVISTLGGNGLDAQIPLGDAAKAAGVKLFVPSEFSIGTVGLKEGFYAPKNVHRERLEKIGMPWALFFTGPFADWFFNAAGLGYDIDNGKMEVAGSGDYPISFTTRRDIARYVAHVLTTLPPEKLHNGIFKVEGERTTFNRVVSEYRDRTGKKVDVNYLALDAVKKGAKEGNFKAWAQLMFVEDGVYGTEEEMNADWPEFNPEKVVDAILNP